VNRSTRQPSLTIALPPPITAKPNDVAVKRPAVHLERQPLRRERHVDLVAPTRVPHLPAGDPRTAQEPVQQPLGARTRAVGGRRQQHRGGRRTAPPEVAPVHPPQHGQLHVSLQCAVEQHRTVRCGDGSLQDRQRNTRHLEVAYPRHVVAGQVTAAGAHSVDPRCALGMRNGHVHHRGRPADDAVPPGGGHPMGGRLVAAGCHRCPHAHLIGVRVAAHQVHAAGEATPRAGANPATHCLLTQSRRRSLRGGDDASLLAKHHVHLHAS